MTHSNVTHSSSSFKARLKRGREIADQLVPVMSCEEVAAKLGVSHQYVRRTELLALAKLDTLMKEACRNAKFAV